MSAPVTEEAGLSIEQEQRHALIVRNLQEVLGDAKIREHLKKGKNIHVYWGTATTGRPHVTILFADLHGFLDNLKSTFELLENRVLYYEYIIKALLRAFNVPLDKLSFVKGTSYQLSEAYTRDVLRLCGQVSQRDALKAGAEVVKQVGDPLLSGLMYPLLQALDEQHLKVDGQFGGVDQRKIFILAEEQLPKLKLGKRYHLMNPMVPGLTGTKMSSSEENTKIDLLDAAKVVEHKIRSAACPTANEQNSENGVLAFFKHVVFPICESVNIGDVHFTSSDDLIDAFNGNKLSEEQLKTYLINFLNGVLDKVRLESESEQMKQILTKAYTMETKDMPVSVVPEKINEPNADDKVFLENLGNDLKLYSSARLLERIQSQQPIRVVWRVSVKTQPHLGYILPLLEFQRLKKLGCECFVLLSDLGGFLDGGKCPWKQREKQMEYYYRVLRAMLDTLELQDVPIRHSDEHQFKSYTLDMYKLASKMTLKETASVSQDDGQYLASHLVPIYQFLDVHYADADLHLIGEHQHEYMSDRSGLPRQAALLHNIVNGMHKDVNSKRMSSSQSLFHLSLADKPKQIKDKVARSFCQPGNLEGNVAIQWAQKLIFPLNDNKPQIIKRSEQNGGDLNVETVVELEQLFVNDKLHPADLKGFVVEKLADLLSTIKI